MYKEELITVNVCVKGDSWWNRRGVLITMSHRGKSEEFIKDERKSKEESEWPINLHVTN